MLFGVICGCTAAVMQSVSYIFSRSFVAQHKSPIYLAIYSQIVMGILGAILFVICLKFTAFPSGWLYYLLGLAWMTTYLSAQISFFQALKTVEASRLSSLLGTKVIALALLAMVFGTSFTPIRWVAVVLCTVAAVGMNFSGAKLSARSVFWIALAVLSYALCDLSCTKMVVMMPGDNILYKSLGVVAVSYSGLGIISLPALFFVPRKTEYLRDASSFGVAWFVSMIFLMVAFGSLGVVFGTILQSGRGIVSVIIGAILLHFGYKDLEPQVSKRKWIQRLCMAILMLCAMIIYALGNR